MRERLLTAAQIHPMAEGVRLAKQAADAGQTPVVLADHSDRSGYATWLLREVIAQDVGRTLIGTIADAGAIRALLQADVQPGDPFDRAVGGAVDPSAGPPVRVTGRVLGVHRDVGGRHGIGAGGSHTWISVAFGRGNVLVLSPFLAQIIDPEAFAPLGLDAASFDIVALKSRVHFRRGFDDSGFAKTILLVEPPEPFLGTVRLDALPYENADIKRLYPYGTEDFDAGP
jgi:microcystin degradation protein MlrC